MSKPPKFVYGISEQSWLLEEMIKAGKQNEKDCRESIAFQQSMEELNVKPEVALEHARAFAMLEELLKYYYLTPREN
jgi:hypothetical protein